MEEPNRTITVYFQHGSRGGIAIIAQLYAEGWEMLESTQYSPCCGYYYTTLYLPE